MIEVSDKNELKKQLQKNKKVLALFYSSWCPFCRSFLPVFARNCAKNSFDLALYVRVDEDENPLWEEYAIDAVPTVILFEDGKVFRRLDGRFGYGLNEKQFKELLQEETSKYFSA